MSFRHKIELYHDGKIVEVRTVWSTDLEDELDKVEKQGYTYGFTKKEVEKTKQQYERMLKNIIS